MSTLTTVELLRHGECEGGGIYKGSLDLPLSTEGWRQMRQAAANQQYWDAIVSSPMRRCAEFAAELAEQLRLPLTEDEDWREMAFGVWEGRHYRDIEAESPGRVRRFIEQPEGNEPEGGEEVGDFRDRVARGWSNVLDRYAGKRVLVISHGGVIRILQCILLQQSLATMPRIEVPYACRSQWQAGTYLGVEGWAQLNYHNGPPVHGEGQ